MTKGITSVMVAEAEAQAEQIVWEQSSNHEVID